METHDGFRLHSGRQYCLMWQVGTIAGNEMARNTPNQMAIGVLVGQLVGLPQTFEGTENSMSHLEGGYEGCP